MTIASTEVESEDRGVRFQRSEEVVPIDAHDESNGTHDEVGDRPWGDPIGDELRQSSGDEVTDLRDRVAELQGEVSTLLRRIQDAPKRVRTLEERLLETKGQLAQAVAQNEKLSYTLREARDHIAALRDEVDKLTQPPAAYATLLGINDDGTVDIVSSGRKMRVEVSPSIEASELRCGVEVVLNESFTVVMVRSQEIVGEVVTLREVLEDGRRALIVGRADEERVAELGDALRGQRLRAGDVMLMDTRSSVLLEKLPRPEVDELMLEEVPDIAYSDIGGLDDQIEQITDAVELPFLHQAKFSEYKLPAPKGILLYGPPGCGKTLIAKAVANSLAKKVAEMTGRDQNSYFISIMGPELLNKYVGGQPHVCRGVNISRGGMLIHKVLEPDVPHLSVTVELAPWATNWKSLAAAWSQMPLARYNW